MTTTPAHASHPIQSLLGQSDSPDNPVKQLVATENKNAIIATSLKVLTSLVNQVWEFTNETWTQADQNFTVAFNNAAKLEKRVEDLENTRTALHPTPIFARSL